MAKTKALISYAVTEQLIFAFVLAYAKNRFLHYMAHIIEQCHEKTNVLVSDLVRHKPGCTAIEDG